VATFIRCRSGTFLNYDYVKRFRSDDEGYSAVTTDDEMFPVYDSDVEYTNVVVVPAYPGFSALYYMEGESREECVGREPIIAWAIPNQEDIDATPITPSGKQPRHSVLYPDGQVFHAGAWYDNEGKWLDNVYNKEREEK
jgi:hypothetical protein